VSAVQGYAGGGAAGGGGLRGLSLNQATVRHLALDEVVALCLRHEIPAIGLWRDKVAEHGLARSAAAVRGAGLHVSSLCRGGFFTHADPGARAAALADNRAALAEAARLGADTLILVSGGMVPGSRDLGLARRMVADAVGELAGDAERLGVRLGVEALHPMFCADRCVLSRLGDAVDLVVIGDAGIAIAEADLRPHIDLDFVAAGLRGAAEGAPRRPAVARRLPIDRARALRVS